MNEVPGLGKRGFGWWSWVVFCFGAITLGVLSGCGVLDGFFGVNPDGTRSGEGAAGVVGPILGTWIPGASAALAGLGGIWAAIRGRNWKKAATATFETIEAGAVAGKQVMELKKDLAAAHQNAGVYGMVQKVVGKM